MVNDDETRYEKGMSLSRGPALVLGTILLAAGLYFLYKQHTFQHFSNFPDGNAPVDGKVLFGIFGANGWTGMLTAVGGGLLLFGAAQHVLAKTMSLIVGVALGAAAIIALVSGNVLGMAAANGWTKIGWAIAAAILLFNALLPRRRRAVAAGQPADRTAVGRRDHTRRHEAEAAGAGAAAGAYAEHRHDRHVAEREAAEDRTMAHERGHGEDETVAHDRGHGEDATVAHDRAGHEDQTVAHDRAAAGDENVPANAAGHEHDHTGDPAVPRAADDPGAAGGREGEPVRAGRDD